jgi:hypothetical protein
MFINNTISEVDIKHYLWNKSSQKKCNNSKNNDWRENCIVDMLKMYISKVPINGNSHPNFLQVYNSLISVFNNVYFKDKHGEIKEVIVKGGRGLNYDIELITEKSYNIKIEFKFHIGKEVVENIHQVHKIIPQCLQVYLNNNRSILSIGDETYLDNYYSDYLPKIKDHYQLQNPLCSLELYKKNITETLSKNNNGLYYYSQNLENDYKQFMEEFYNATKNEIRKFKQTIGKNSRDNFSNKCFYNSRNTFLERYGKEINYHVIDNLLKEKVNTRDYYLVYNCQAKKFTLIENKEISVKNSSSLLYSKNQKKSILIEAELDKTPVNLECLLRWKNTNGCIGPAWQIGLKYPKKKRVKKMRISHPSQAVKIEDLNSLKLSDMKKFINKVDQKILYSLKGRKTKKILVPLLWGIRNLVN